jgi:hypothetical protein
MDLLRRLRIVSLLFLAALLAGSCGSVEPDGTNALANGVTFEAERNYAFYNDGIGHGSMAEIHAYATGSAAAVDAGEVKVNGNAITRRNDIAGGGIFYADGLDYAGEAPIAADESVHHLAISGSDRFAPFADSIRAPRRVRVTEPELMEKISKAKGFTVVWEGTDAPGDSVTIELHDGIYQYLLRKRVPDIGVAVLTGTDLNGVPYGSVLVGVNRIVSRVITHPDGRRSDMTISTKTLVEVEARE